MGSSCRRITPDLADVKLLNKLYDNNQVNDAANFAVKPISPCVLGDELRLGQNQAFLRDLGLHRFQPFFHCFEIMP